MSDAATGSVLDWDGLSVTVVGSGQAVLWLHGYSLRSEVWGPLWARLPGFSHYGLDLPWHGGSRDRRPDEDLALLADLVVDRALAAGVTQVVALSFGTVLAVEMAARHPDAFHGWVLAAPALAGMRHEPAVEHRYRELAELYAARGPGPHLTALWMSTPPDIFAGVQARPRVAARLRSLIDRHEWRELGGFGVRPLLTREQRPADLAGLAAPLHLVIGQGELLMHRACARSLAAAAPAGRLHVVAGCGHLALLEEPVIAADVLAPLLVGPASSSPTGAGD